MHKDLADACDQRAPPETIFRLASKYHEPLGMGIMPMEPYSMAPLTGFVVNVGGTVTFIKSFACEYFDKNSGKQVTAYFGLNDLISLDFTCLCPVLASALMMADYKKGEVAMKQYVTHFHPEIHYKYVAHFHPEIFTNNVSFNK